MMRRPLSRRHGLSACALLLVSTLSAPYTATAFDLKKIFQDVTTSTSSGRVAALSQGEIGQGLKEALAQGVQRAVAALGKPDGFLSNAKVKIPMPESLQKIESALRAVGQDKYADEFITSINRAAEQAVPEAASIFSDAINQMSVDDARKILSGPDNAATEYFQRVSTEQLVGRFRPIVERATDAVGVTSSYKDLVGKAGFVGSLLGKDTTDLDGYVTKQAVGGLFTMVAQEEKRIRTEPVARTSELLKKVFGS
ncbi:MAG: hypothetical protein ACI9W2_003877 [Gammaproteobacteria bacterium]|jgi:hypothetical protein